MRVVREVRVDQRQGQHHQQRTGEQAQHAHQRTTPVEVARAQHDREVDHVRARHDLRHGPFLDEFLLCHPALFLHQLALHHREHATEALQREQREGDEQVGEVAGLHSGRRRGHRFERR